MIQEERNNLNLNNLLQIQYLSKHENRFVLIVIVSSRF